MAPFHIFQFLHSIFFLSPETNSKGQNRGQPSHQKRLINNTQKGTTDRRTHGQPDLLTELAQRANSVKIMVGPNHPSPDCQ